MKRSFFSKLCFYAFLFLLCFSFIFAANSLNKYNKNITMCYTHNLDVVDDIQNQVESQLDDLNTNQLDEILKNFSERQKDIFGNSSVADKIKKIINGSENFQIGDMFGVLFSAIFDNMASVIPILASICSIAILSSLLLQMRGSKMNKSLQDIIHFACYGVIVTLVFGGVVELVKITSSTLSLLKTQMEIMFPILLTLMASIGSNVSVSIYQPLIAVLCGIMMQAFINVILPIFSLILVFNVIGNLTSTVKLSKFSSFLINLFKTIITFSFTIFGAFLTLSGIVANSYDRISIRATKFAIKSYVPIIGSYISDGFGLIITSNILIKNVLGYTGIVILFLTIISPLIKIFLYKLGLSLVAGIIEPVADKRVTEFVDSSAKSMSMLSNIILAFSFAYIICVGLIMCSANVV